MPGPPPKPAAQRRRRNVAPGSRVLAKPAEAALPGLPERAWHPMTVAWWADVARSPMAPEFEGSDVHGLLMLALLVDEFWNDPSTTLAAEIRLQRQCFGLSPLDRRRLQWETERAEAAAEATKQRRAATPASKKTSATARAAARRLLEGGST